MLRRHIAAELPEIAQSLVGVVVAPVGVAVFKEYVSVFVEHVVASTTSCRHVKVENNLIVSLLKYSVEELAEIGLGLLGRDGEAVNLEDADAIFPIEFHDSLNVLLPVLEVVLDTRIEPEAKLDSEFLCLLDHRSQPVRVLVLCRSPVERVVPDVPERALCHRGVWTLALLPAVVNLEMRDAKTRGLLKFREAEDLVHLRVLAAVAPCVHHYHLVTLRAVLPDVFLIGTQSLERRELPFAEDARHAGVELHPVGRLEVSLRSAYAGDRKIAEFADEVRAGIAQLDA